MGSFPRRFQVNSGHYHSEFPLNGCVAKVRLSCVKVYAIVSLPLFFLRHCIILPHR